MTVPLVDAGLLSLVGAPLRAVADAGLSAVSAWVIAGAVLMLGEVVKLVSLITTPTLSASWFSGTYWRLSGLALLLTIPFLCAAAVQAILRSDIGVLLRAFLVDLPVAIVAVTLASPLITLLLAGTDQMCAVMTGGHPLEQQFLALTSRDLAEAGGGVLLMVIAFVILLAGMTLVVELILRAAAIYVVVLFLPLGLAAMVWPARRIWIRRMLEVLLALILSKFAMVAVLTLALTAVASVTTDPSALTSAFTAMALLILAAFSPWALLRLLPFTEVIHDAAHHLRSEAQRGLGQGARSVTSAAGIGLTLGSELIAGPIGDGLAWMRGATAPTREPARPLTVLGGSDAPHLPPAHDGDAGDGSGPPGDGPDTGRGGSGSGGDSPWDPGHPNEVPAGPWAAEAGGSAGPVPVAVVDADAGAGDAGERWGPGQERDVRWMEELSPETYSPDDRAHPVSLGPLGMRPASCRESTPDDPPDPGEPAGGSRDGGIDHG